MEPTSCYYIYYHHIQLRPGLTRRETFLNEMTVSVGLCSITAVSIAKLCLNEAGHMLHSMNWCDVDGGVGLMHTCSIVAISVSCWCSCM